MMLCLAKGRKWGYRILYFDDDENLRLTWADGPRRAMFRRYARLAGLAVQEIGFPSEVKHFQIIW